MSSDSTQGNPLLETWKGPYGGLPPFAEARVAHFEPAFARAMEEMRREIDAIARDEAPATFANTIAKLEDAGRVYTRVDALYGVWSSTMSGPEFQAIERVLAPRLAAFSDETVQNTALFARIRAVYEAEDPTLTPEQRRLVWKTYRSFVRSGAKLDEAAKARLSELNQRLAALYTDFSQRLLADEEKIALVVEEARDLDGLPEAMRDAAQAAAAARGLAGKWAIENTRSAIEPFLTYASRRDLREKAFRAFVMRGDNDDQNDTKAIVAEVLSLRAERAKLLGYTTHAHWRLEDSMAETPEGAMALMQKVWPSAIARVREEVAEMQALAGAEEPIEPWDYRYYAEKVRKAKYDFDENEVKPYLQLDKIREAMFWVAGELFGLSFRLVDDVAVYHPAVRVWEVEDATGRHVGLWFFDPYARAGKQSGAWMSAYRAQERFANDTTTLVSNNANLVRGKEGEPVLVGWTDASTLFHEFGHALHGLLSDVSYPSLSGTNVARDFVELPSQLFEHWLATPEVLERFAIHHATGKPMPAALVAKITAAATFNQGFGTVEYLSAALIDMKLHLAGSAPIDPAAFERETLAELGMPASIVMRHRTPQFAHVFSGDAYSAGYYSYLWADALTADVFEAFVEGGGPYAASVARRYRDAILAVGDTVDPAEAYRAFRGRDVDVDALMRKRGLH